MRLFVFERGMKQNILLDFFGIRQRPDQPNFNETQNAEAASLSVERMSGFINETDPVTNRLYRKAKLFFQAFANLQGNALDQLGAALRVDEPARPAADVLIEQSRRSRIHTKEHIKSAIRNHVLATEEITAEQKQQILDTLLARVDAIDFTGVEQYLLGQNPDVGIPQTFLNSCQEAIRDVPRNAMASMYSGLSRCAASFTNFVVEGSNFTVDAARTGIGQVSRLFRMVFAPAPAAADVEVPEDALNILHNIDAVAHIDQIEPGLHRELPPVPLPGDAGNVAVGDALGMNDDDEQLRPAGPRGGRSRKRSAAKRTRRKGKQSSKNLKRKSRRYVRRASSRKGRK
jgi:hypothetical protein